MKKIFKFPILVFCASVATISLGTNAASEEKRITTENEFRSVIVGKKNVFPNGYIILHDDSSISGEIQGKNVTGAWLWAEKYFCRNITIGTRNLGNDCQVVIVSGDKMSIVRNRGKGKTVTSRIEAQ